MSPTLTAYQEQHLSLWSRTQMVDFLMSEGQRSPRSKLRRRPIEWLMRECAIEGALQCHNCGEETSRENPILDSAICQQCQTKADEDQEEAL
jgi:hypothetical protein